VHKRVSGSVSSPKRPIFYEMYRLAPPSLRPPFVCKTYIFTSICMRWPLVCTSACNRFVGGARSAIEMDLSSRCKSVVKRHPRAARRNKFDRKDKLDFRGRRFQSHRLLFGFCLPEIIQIKIKRNALSSERIQFLIPLSIFRRFFLLKFFF